jgi:hypothetical protein
MKDGAFDQLYSVATAAVVLELQAFARRCLVRMRMWNWRMSSRCIMKIYRQHRQYQAVKALIPCMVTLQRVGRGFLARRLLGRKRTAHKLWDIVALWLRNRVYLKRWHSKIAVCMPLNM